MVVDQKIVLFRVLKFKRLDISWPIIFLFWLICFRAKNFLSISFWSGFSRMFLFYVFSWLVEKYKNVTSMLMRFWSKISRMFLCMFLLFILRLKNVYSILLRPCAKLKKNHCKQRERFLLQCIHYELKQILSINVSHIFLSINLSPDRHSYPCLYMIRIRNNLYLSARFYLLRHFSSSPPLSLSSSESILCQDTCLLI